MYIWTIYYENADTDTPKKPIGQINADTMADALHKASQYFEIPEYNLVVERQSDLYRHQ